jgi:hypothetical protein
MSSETFVPVSVGELFDKISILEIKSERLTDQAKLKNVTTEMRLLREIAAKLDLGDRLALNEILPRLKAVNEQIWDAEDEIRDCERHGVFDDRFLKVARSIYRLNDARAAAKREINVLTSSTVVEEKSYAAY